MSVASSRSPALGPGGRRPAVARAGCGDALPWLFVFGEPDDHDRPACSGGLITWLKVVSLFCLLGWVVSWLVDRAQGADRRPGRLARHRRPGGARRRPRRDRCSRCSRRPSGIAGLRARARHPVVALLGCACAAGPLPVWVEVGALADDPPARPVAATSLVLLGIHLALALGIGVGLRRCSSTAILPDASAPDQHTTWRDGLIYGVRLARRTWATSSCSGSSAWFCGELVAVRPPAALRDRQAERRSRPTGGCGPPGWSSPSSWWSWRSPTGSSSRPRPAEMGRLFVGTLTLLCSLLLTVMVTILTPLSLPHGHPEADDLHGRLQAGPAARADLGPDARLHGDRDGPGRWSSAGSACSTSGGPSAARSTTTEAAGREGQEREPDDRGQRSSASRPTSSGRGCRPGCRSRARCRSSTRAGRRTRWGSTSARSSRCASRAATSRGRRRRRRSGASASSPTRSPPASRPVLLDRRIPVDDFLAARHGRGPAQPGLRAPGADRRGRAGAKAPARPAGRPGHASSTRRSTANQRGARAGQRRVRGAQGSRPTTSRPRPPTAEQAARPTEADSAPRAGRGAALAARSPSR